MKNFKSIFCIVILLTFWKSASSQTPEPNSKKSESEDSLLLASVMNPIFNYDEEFSINLIELIDEFPKGFENMKGEKKQLPDKTEYWVSNYKMMFTIEGTCAILPAKKTNSNSWIGIFILTENKKDALEKYKEICEKVSKTEVSSCKLNKVEKTGPDGSSVTGWLVSDVLAGKDERLKDLVIKVYYVVPQGSGKKYAVRILISNIHEE